MGEPTSRQWRAAFKRSAAFDTLYKQRASVARGRSYHSYSDKRRRINASKRGYLRTGGYYGWRGQGERKFIDKDVANFTIAVTGNSGTASLNLIASGTGESQRIGRKAVLLQIDLRGYMVHLGASASTGPLADPVTVYMILDKQANGAQATWADVFDTAHPLSFRNLANKDRFTVLGTKRFVMQTLAGGGDIGASNSNWTNNAKFYSMHWQGKIPVEFNNTTGAITEVRSKNVFLLFISETGTASTLYKTRVRFTDA